ncbi:hypothetical protein HNQ36_003997 [Afipia massiliensis]|uniref:Uncharacterized protein n=1 Tax=Afipia massiliensis TaxID=211460 RepID=A0A840N5Z9_9BRAD|nr:hypothetical protein [Afipia massiliensis]
MKEVGLIAFMDQDDTGWKLLKQCSIQQTLQIL